MAWCDKQFDKWNQQLKLSSEQWGRVTSAFNHFVDFCNQSSGLSPRMAEPPFFQGSAATNTIVRPLADREFDVDIVCSLSLPGVDARSALEWFKSQLWEDDFYSKHRVEKDRCVRINYAGEFHVDIIPATQDIEGRQPYAIPAKDVSDWVRTDPIGFRDWVRRIDQRSRFEDSSGEGAFRRSIRYLKRWRDDQLNEESSPSSMLLVTMMGRHDPTIPGYMPPLENPLYPEYKHDAAYLYDMMRLTHSCIGLARQTAFMNPVDPFEDLSRDWSDSGIEMFIERLGNACEELRIAIYADSEQEAIQHFRNALGDSFPAS